MPYGMDNKKMIWCKVPLTAFNQFLGSGLVVTLCVSTLKGFVAKCEYCMVCKWRLYAAVAVWIVKHCSCSQICILLYVHCFEIQHALLIGSAWMCVLCETNIECGILNICEINYRRWGEVGGVAVGNTSWRTELITGYLLLRINIMPIPRCLAPLSRCHQV